MKNLILLVSLLFFTGCSWHWPWTPIVNIKPDAKVKNFKYIPIDPLPSVSYYDPTDKNQTNRTPWRDQNNTSILNALSSLRTDIYMRKLDRDFSLEYSGSSLSSEEGSFEVIIDFSKYRINVRENNESKIDRIARIGIGMRITANVLTTSSSVNIGSLAGLSAGYSNGDLTGTVTVDIIGISSRDTTLLMPITSDISEASIQNILLQLASIKTLIHSPKTKLEPHVLAIKKMNPRDQDLIGTSETTIQKSGSTSIVKESTSIMKNMPN